MRLRCLIVLLAFGFSALDARGQSQPVAPPAVVPSGESYNLAPGRAIEKGAVYELKLRLPSNEVEGYLVHYARWYLPVDQTATSGRKLLSVLSRDMGDEYNLVFLYRYESAYKENYYCQYRKTFFEQHTKNKNIDDLVKDYFLPVLKRWLSTEDAPDLATAKRKLVDEVVPRLRPADCTDSPYPQEELAMETLQAIDLQLAKRVTVEKGAWNFEINLCKVMKLQKRPIPDDVRTAACTDFPPSILTRAVEEIDWSKKWVPKHDQRPQP